MALFKVRCRHAIFYLLFYNAAPIGPARLLRHDSRSKKEKQAVVEVSQSWRWVKWALRKKASRISSLSLFTLGLATLLFWTLTDISSLAGHSGSLCLALIITGRRRKIDILRSFTGIYLYTETIHYYIHESKGF
jgi:hypothetical protein